MLHARHPGALGNSDGQPFCLPETLKAFELSKFKQSIR